MKTNTMVSAIVLSSILVACGGGGGGSSTPTPTPGSGSGSNPVSQQQPPAPPTCTAPQVLTNGVCVTPPAPPAPVTDTVTLTPSVTSVAVNTSFNLTWSSNNTDVCTASGDWSGVLASTGTQAVTPTTVGTANYTITCGTTPASTSVNVLAQYVSIPDPVFADALTRLGYPVTNGKMLTTDAQSITKIIITSMANYYGQADVNNTSVYSNSSVLDNGAKVAYTTGALISDVTGLESFTNLQTFRIEAENITSINLAPLTNLTFMSLWREPLVSIDLSHNVALQSVGLSETSLTTVDLSAQVNMVEAALQQGQTTPYTTGANNNVTVTGFNSINFANDTNLTRLYIGSNNLTSIDLSAAKNSLQECWCGGNPFASIDFTGFTQLQVVMLMQDTSMTTVKMSAVTPRNFNTIGSTVLSQVLVPNVVLSWWNAEYTSMLAANLAATNNQCSNAGNPCFNAVNYDAATTSNPAVGY